MSTRDPLHDLKSRLDYEGWRGQHEGDRNVFIWHFFFAGHELPGFKLHRARADRAYAEAIFVSDGNERSALLDLRVELAPSAAEAKEHLLTALSDVQGPNLERKPIAGDVSFTVPGDGAVYFTRGNAAVRVLNGGKALVAADRIAGLLDRLLIGLPNAGKAGVSPSIERFDLDASRAKEGDRLELQAHAVDPLARPVWLRFVSAPGEIRETGHGLAYEVGAKGQHEIEVTAFNANGGAASKRVHFVVA